MAFVTPGRRIQPLPELAIQRRDGRLVHQPFRGDLIGSMSFSPSVIPTTAQPTTRVEKTQMSIVSNETLRIAAPGPGLPGSYVPPSVLRDTTGRTSGVRAGIPSPSAIPTTSAGAGLFDRMAAKLPGAGSSGSGAIPYEGGMDPVGVRLTPEQYAEATGTGARSVPLPPPVARQLTPLGVWWGENSAKIVGGLVGFAAGFALLRWRAK